MNFTETWLRYVSVGLTSPQTDARRTLTRPLVGDIVLVCGPPGGGKSTWRKEHRPAGIIIDWYRLNQAIAAHPRKDRHVDILKAVENTIFDAWDARPHNDRGALTIERTAAAVADRDRYRHLGAKVVMVTAPRDTCIERCAHRKEGSAYWTPIIDEWFDAANLGSGLPDRAELITVKTDDAPPTHKPHIESTALIYDPAPVDAQAPGTTLAELLEERSIKAAELAVRTGLTRGTITGLLAGTEPLTHNIATRLEEALGAPAHVWLNLEASWRRTTP
jgi:plasmid maintenance system antidote protein VapI/predicted kinase